MRRAYDAVVDGRILQKQRKISYQLESVDQKIRDIRFSSEIPQLWILCINATGPLHQGREIIIDVLKNGGSVRVLLLDPIHNIFDCRTEVEHDYVGRISAELLASVYILLDILHQVGGTEGAAERLELRFHHEPPNRSLIMVNCEQENGLVLANTYPAKKPGPRGEFEPEPKLNSELRTDWQQHDVSH